ncbi:collagen-binding domain-containing protein [Salibacterium qingdaonense]|uniref:Prepilin-type N-terminal cleavage/methylation domain-containing protein n=1 Tax=Salibacterium qingdaonense TaxID=266892 RepID=A0A1I4HTY0_9BACI|nr:collagen-binding domain-containing protein [Salibacterium qingdaonense]SFL45669.1 hypothetical protein SAMN04488054_10117 [Salibacterium qingdaonense]
MIHSYYRQTSGVTLIEVLLTLLLSSIVIGLVTTVLVSSVSFNERTQSHVNLRQEANIIVTELRQRHQGDTYNLCGQDMFSDGRFHAEDLSIHHDNTTIAGVSDCAGISPDEPLDVQFTLADDHNQTFTVDTVIEARQADGGSVVTLDPPEPGGDFEGMLSELFIFGSSFTFQGNNVYGDGSSVFIRDPLETSDFNGGAFTGVTNIYIDDAVTLDGGSAGLGSAREPGEIHVNGDLELWGGTRHIYGDVYVNGDFRLKDAHIHGNVYVDGDVELGWTPSFEEGSSIYYSGTLKKPSNYHSYILDRMIKETSVPAVDIPDMPFPEPKADEWYAEQGYNQSIQPEDMTLYGSDITIESYNDNDLGRYVDTFTNAVVVSRGDITIRSGGLSFSGFLYAPNGEVTFNGSSFEGSVIARDGFHVTSGGTDVTFRSIEHYIDNPADYPFQNGGGTVE